MNKLVILVVDTSSSFAPLYNDLLNAYLNPLLARMFNEQANQPQTILHEVGLVLFRDYTPDSEYLVKSSTFSSDFKEIRWSLNNLQFGPTSIFPARPLVEALCCATKMTRLKEAKEKHIIVVSNTPVASDIICHSCNELDNCFEHATRLKKEHIHFSVITGRQLEGIQELWEAAKLDTKDHTPTLKTTSPYHTVLLRGLSITPIIPVANSPSIPTVQSTSSTVTVNPPTNVANNTIIEPKKEPTTTAVQQPQPPPPQQTQANVQAPTTTVPPTTSSVKPIWEGTVTWPSTQSPAAPFCELIAYPASRDTDPASYGASEWPSKLEVTGVAPTKDPSIAPFYKTAKVIEFVPSKKGDQYRNLYQQLAQKSWAAVVYLQQKTLLILPHGATEKLVGLLLPKLSLTQQRSSPGNQPGVAAPPTDSNKQAIHNKPVTISVQNSPTMNVTSMGALNANKLPPNTGAFPSGSIQNFTATQIKNFNGNIMTGQPSVTVTGNGMQPMQHANFRGFMQGTGNVNVNTMNPMLLQQLQQQQQQQQLRGAQQQQGNQPTSQHFSL